MNAQQQPRVCVVGAGMAGLACALAAAQTGASVQVLEGRDRVPSVPAHVNVVPGMLRGLATLGLADTLVRRGFPFRSTDVAPASGQVLFKLEGERLAGSQYPAMLGIRYDDLIDVLHDAARAAGVRVRFGLSLAANSAEELSSGEKADLVVIATGAGSRFTRKCFPHAPECTEIGQLWWRAIVARPLALDAHVLVMGYDGDRAGAIPIGMNHAGLYLLQRDDGAALPEPAQRVIQLRTALSRYRAGVLAQTAALLMDDSTVLVERVRHALMPAPWHRGRFIAVGDAAHSITPQFGHNGSQAIEDAVVLGSLLAQRVALDDLPAEFTRRRVARVAKAHEICLKAARWDLRPQPQTNLHALWQQLGEVMAVEP